MNLIHVKEQNVRNYQLLTALQIHAIMVGPVFMLTTVLIAIANLDGMEKLVTKKLSSARQILVVLMDSARTKKTNFFAIVIQDGQVFV